MKEAQLTAAGIVKDVLEGGNLDKVFQKYLKEKKLTQKSYLKLKTLPLELFVHMEKQNLSLIS